MALIDGLLTGLVTGLCDGLNGCVVASGPTLLADFDFSAPLTSWTTGRDWFSSAFATDEWLIGNTTYSAGYANNVGSEAMVDYASGLTAQTAPDVYTDTGYGVCKAWEADAVQDMLRADGVVAGDFDHLGGEDMCFRIVFRFPTTPPATEYLISKFGTVNGGWRVYTVAGGDRVVLGISSYDGGLNSVSLYSEASPAGNYSDGAVHYITGWVDSTAQIAYIKSDCFDETSISTATISDTQNASRALTINGYAQSTAAGAAQVQFIYAGTCIGASAQSMYDEDFWQHAQDPTGLLTTVSRNSLISVPVSATNVAHFSGGTTPATTQIPIGYNAAFSDTDKLGLYCNSAVTNLCLQSESLTAAGAWNDFNTTRADNVADSPDGFRNAGSVTATANNGPIWDQTAGADSTEYTFSAWVKRNGGSDVAGSIKQYDTANATFFATQTFTATDTWQLITCTGTMGTGTSGLRHYCYVDVSGESVLFWGMQHNLGSARGAYIRTNGASAALVASGYKSSSAPMSSLAGEVVSVFIQEITDDFYLWQPKQGAASINNLINAYNTATPTPRLYWANNAGGAEANHYGGAFSFGSETTLRHLWDTAGIDAATYETAIYVNGARSNGAAMPLEGTIDNVTCNDFPIGYSGTGFHMNGLIQSVKVYDGVGAL